ncbi:hypothetical protein ILYODFUR_007366 [Ilyodon furcidens]|uniref:Uncharacterized protein n=1 Tax=Ilyodon furcidens TaxID=33524 RepID=A0ABV0U4S0_9TELE
MKSSCHAFSFHAVRNKCDKYMCVTVVLAGASNVSCQSVHKHVSDRCHKSKYAFEAMIQSQSQGVISQIISFYCKLCHVFGLLGNESQECLIYPREPQDSNAAPEERNISCTNDFIQTELIFNKCLELVSQVLAGEANLTVKTLLGLLNFLRFCHSTTTDFIVFYCDYMWQTNTK